MMCVVCNQAEIIFATTSVLLERDELSLVIKNVPAQVCPNCGEAYADETVTTVVLREAEKMAMAGAKMDVIEYMEKDN
ncbi:MAG: type II toxin-antitoxin system MqsA family antitoxin [Anaerolineae bacterium]|nr:type II toxin-antitoxin system MqsA family antitoxin [Anaerolineae bacterium]